MKLCMDLYMESYMSYKYEDKNFHLYYLKLK